MLRQTVSIVALVGLLAVPAVAQTTSAPASRPDLPSAKKLVDKALEAMGGKDKFDAIRSAHVKATMNLDMQGQTMVMDMNMYVARPNRYFKETSNPMMGAGSEGCDGKVAWTNHPMMGGLQVIEDPAKINESYRQAAIYDLVTQLRERFPVMETVDKTDFDGTSCYKVRMVDADEKEAFAFFDVESGRIIGQEQTDETPMGILTSEITFGDWKKIGDLDLYTKMTIKQGPMSASITIDEITFNDVDETVFAAPDEVMAVVKAKSAASPTSQPDGK